MSVALDEVALKSRLREVLDWDPQQVEITALSGGYSNLTYLINSEKGKFALRRPPMGYKISTAHDMVREYSVLKALEQAGYSRSPQAVYLEQDENILGAPFFIMEFIEGQILRGNSPLAQKLVPEKYRILSQQAIVSLHELHELELEDSKLIELGKPDGYVQRQVTGWANRYQNAKTDQIPALEKVAEWLKIHQPEHSETAFIHNDYKYDNLVLDLENGINIKAVLDWEMATVGDPLMDLGTSLAYWAQEDDPAVLKHFNASHFPGNLTRQEVINYYQSKSGKRLDQMVFYYVFGLFKVAVIAQQIYKRYQLGQAKDSRFAMLIEVVKAAGKLAETSIRTEKI